MIKSLSDVVNLLLVCFFTKISDVLADPYCAYNHTTNIFGISVVVTRYKKCDGFCCDTDVYRCCTESENSGLIAAGIVGGVLFLLLLFLVLTLVIKAAYAKRQRTVAAHNVAVVPREPTHRHFRRTGDRGATIPQPPPYTVTAPHGDFDPPPAYPGTPLPVTNVPGTNTNTSNRVSQTTNISNMNKPLSPPPAYFE